ncbi:UNVERIFIED_CONTAM: hypothetical protein Scaly_2215100 [Sesamum calycinum]|uniref:Reverse transcriptase zinc-binding domain-containing protein n=1 Tax=Sesamum calycinum TaxID=2727403 RepID=A0AAW2MPZ8_9LAMI
MCRHLWSVISQDRASIWVDWIIHYRLRDKSIWTVNATKGAWGWKKMLTLRNILLPDIHLRVGSGDSFSLWHDPCHCLGPLILKFPRGPRLTQTAPLDTLSVVIEDGRWRWPLITDIACLEITRLLPPIHHGNDSSTWTANGGPFTNEAAYGLFRPFGPKVGSLFLGPSRFHGTALSYGLLSWGGCPPWINHGYFILMGLVLYATMGAWRHTTTSFLHVLTLDIA